MPDCNWSRKKMLRVRKWLEGRGHKVVGWCLVGHYDENGHCVPQCARCAHCGHVKWPWQEKCNGGSSSIEPSIVAGDSG